MRRNTPKRAKQERVYSKIRINYLTEHPMCVVKRYGCYKHSSEIHHYMQHKEGEALIDERQFVPICSHCHRWIHDNPNEARKAGWLATREEKIQYINSISRWRI